MEERTGSCHCGAVKYKVTLDVGQPVIECNCTYCERQGLLLSFVPGNTLTITEGEGNLTEYYFNTGKIAHMFCKTCGVQCFGRADMESGPGAAVNVRTVDNINLATLTRMPFDGRSR